VRTSLVGRQREVREVTQLLASSQLVTLTGAAGCGKTRLALRVARAMLDEGLPLLREAGNPYWIAMTLNGSGDLARCQQNYAQAQTAYEESIALLRQLDAARDLAAALHNLGHTCLLPEGRGAGAKEAG
jgi:ABC-type glutathione transport system ATPase component